MVSVFSSRVARMISLILRSPERSPVRRKFFITCWVIVEAPRRRLAVHGRVVDRGDDAARVEAVVLVEVLVLGRDEGLLHQVGDLVDGREDPPLAGELVHEDALARVDRG